MQNFDLIVIGSGPAGEKAAVKAAYFNYRVAIIEKNERLGGAAVNTGTIPSKALRETALYLSGKHEKDLYNIQKVLCEKASIEHFLYRKNQVIDSESKAILQNISQHNVSLFRGIGSFIDEHTIRIVTKDGSEKIIQGKNIIIATGSTPYHPSKIPFDTTRIHDSDSILNIRYFPKSICIVGAGVTGCEYSTIFSTMGSKVFLVNKYDVTLPFLDQEIAEALITQMKKDGVQILFNDDIASVKKPNNIHEPLNILLKSNKPLLTDMFLFTVGRKGNVDDLCLEKINVQTNSRKQILVDEKYRTHLSHIYAVGDVIGFPSLASTSQDQGRIAVSHIIQSKDLDHIAKILPFAIYTVPEVSTVGLSEEKAQKEKINYCIGKAHYCDMPRGKIMGLKKGFLKIIFDRDSLIILGVHIIGTIASELIHYGLSLVQEKKTLMNVISSVFNYPTLHDLYKYACYDALSNLTGHKVKT